MSLRAAYILGAGLGTRMGPVGEVLPKLLWPVFEKSLLELQVNYAHECGVEKIYLNTHFQADIIKKFVIEKEIEVEVLHEEPLLDIGGAIHNLARRIGYDGRVLILNGDQFLLLSDESFRQFTLSSHDYVATLLGLEVGEGSSYNELVVTDNLLKDISQPATDKKYVTYSGVSIVNLSRLTPVDGRSKFFKTIANFEEEDVYVFKPTSFEYWDFGTTERYCKSMREVLKNGKTKFRNFLTSHNAFDIQKAFNSNYACKNGKNFSINLSGVKQEEGFGNILLSGSDKNYGSDQVVIYGKRISRP